MLTEQPSELNKFVDPTIPLTWRVRWTVLKPGLPLLITCAVLLSEMVAFRLWLNDRSLVSNLHLLVAGPIFLMALFFGALEADIRSRQRARRTLLIGAKSIRISPAKFGRIPWKRITEWRLEPIAHAPGLSKLTLLFHLTKHRQSLRQWAMVLQERDQEHALISELEHLRQIGVNTAQVVKLREPSMGQPQRKVPVRGLVLASLVFYLCVHGFPLLGVGLMPSAKSSDDPAPSRFSARESAKLGKTVAHYFSSIRQFRSFLIITGGSMTAVGVGLWVYAMSTFKPPARLNGDREGDDPSSSQLAGTGDPASGSAGER